MEIDEITINQYKNAKWKDDRSLINEEQLKKIENDYIDIAGLFEKIGRASWRERV